MFEKMREQAQQREEAYQRAMLAEQQQLMNCSEKELMVEILLELKKINSHLDDVENDIRIYGN